MFKFQARNPWCLVTGLAGAGLFLVVGGLLLGVLDVERSRADGQRRPPMEIDSPAYPHGDFKADCELCHGTEAWKPVQPAQDFDHGRYGFALSGAHLEVSCTGCHQSLDFTGANPECSTCHGDVHEGTLGSSCDRCHGTRTFIDRSDQLRMHRMSSFPLTGSHVAVDCDLCHQPGPGGSLQFANTASECFVCHQSDFASTQSPNHVSSGYSHDCTECHNTVSWTGGSGFAHRHEAFPLTGGHKGVACESCHGAGGFSALSTDCVSCHQQDYDTTTGPNHQQAGFGTDCSACHNTTTWLGAAFDHSLTSFALKGGHGGLDCNSCHRGGVYTGLRTECVFCHQQDYDTAVNPNHQQAGFSTDCTICHGTTKWLGATFDHGITGFSLSGGHGGLECASCHQGGVYTGLNSDCVACHRQDYDATTNPNHQQAGFSTDCAACHSTTSWLGASFDHDSTYFPVYSGPHRNKWNDCSDCHTNVSNYTIFNCLGCHPHSDKAKTDEKHKEESGYLYESNACYDCHPRGRS